MNHSDIMHMSAAAIAAAVGRRQISARAVVSDHLAAIEQLNPMVNAICTLVEDRALAEAEALDASLALGAPAPPLAGVPVAIKDIVPTAGIRTTFGSRLMAEFVPTEDATIVTRLRKAGAIVLGKTNVPEFAVGANTKNMLFGATRNPWDLGLTAGGSTGGGAVALATGMIALADGSDLGGSVRTPAAFCGVYGLRPTPGLVPLWPTERPWDTLAASGPMARSMADLTLMLTAIAGPLAVSPLSVSVDGRDFRAAADPARAKRLRIGWCADPVGNGIDGAIAARGIEVGTALKESGAVVGEVTLDLSQAKAIFFALRAYGMVANHLARLDKLDRVDPKIQGNVQLGLDQPPQALAAAERDRASFRLKLLSFFETRDILLCPTTAIMPFDVELDYPTTVNGRAMENYVEWLAPAFPATLAGLPALSVPCGVNAEGLPIGLQVIGRPHHEEQVLAVGAAIEKSYPFAFPPLAALRGITGEKHRGH
jgi:amidase